MANGSTYVSPGVYRTANRTLTNTPNGRAPARTTKPAIPKPTYDPGLMSLGGAIQGQQNINNFTDVTPDGTVSYARGADGGVTRNTTLSPEQQRLKDFSGQLFDALKGSWGQSMDMSSLPAAPSTNKYLPSDNFSADRDRIASTMYDRDKTLLDKQYGQEEQQFRDRMANEGIEEGNPKFKMLYDDFNHRREQAYGDARDRATLGGGQEQSRLFGMGQQGFNMETTSRENARNDLMTSRAQPFQEYSSIAGSVQTPQAEAYRPVDIGSTGGAAAGFYDWLKGLNKPTGGGGGGGGRSSGGGSGYEVLGSFDPLAGMPSAPKAPGWGESLLGGLGSGLANGFGLALGSGRFF